MKTYVKVLAAIVVVVAMCTTGCLPCRPHSRAVSFDLAAYTALKTTGTAVVRGYPFLVQGGGGVQRACGHVVRLTPVTPYSKEWFKRSVRGRLLLEAADTREAAFIRTMVADIEGRFCFTEVPAGQYYVTCMIWWTVPTVRPTYYSSSSSVSGGYAWAYISVEDGKDYNIVVTDPIKDNDRVLKKEKYGSSADW